jgi:hypothetical protein
MDGPDVIMELSAMVRTLLVNSEKLRMPRISTHVRYTADCYVEVECGSKMARCALCQRQSEAYSGNLLANSATSG